MHGITHFLHKHSSRDSSRESTPPLDNDESTHTWCSSTSSGGPRSSVQNDKHSKGIPITQRRNSGQQSARSPHEFASSPRDRYSNFVSYFRDVMEVRELSSHRHRYQHSSSHRTNKSDAERTQVSSSVSSSPRYDYRHFVSPLYNDVMDDIQENEYSKCDQYGEISNKDLDNFHYKNRFDNKSFAQKLVESSNTPKQSTSTQQTTDRRGSGSSSSGHHKHKHHSIQDLIRTFSKKVGHWRHDLSERRSSCAAATVSKDQVSNDDFRSRSKSFDGDHLHKVRGNGILDDCGATYQIFDAIVKEGISRRAASQEAEKRRASLGNVPAARHRAADASLDSHTAAILFRNSRGLPVADPFLEKVSRSDLEEDETHIFVKFFKFHKCYDLIPTSAKLLVFDTQLHVKKAFFALVNNGVRAAPLWDSERHEFVGMLTITDFIKILQMYYTSPNVTMEELEEHRLETWLDVLKDTIGPLVSIGPGASLFEAIYLLIVNRIHRLPVIDNETGDVLYILTHKRILRFLFLYINDLPKPSFLQRKLRELQIGTLNDIETATEGTSIIQALSKFVNRRVSALPIIDTEGRLKDIYAKFDVINLAAEKSYNNLNVTLKEANEHRNEWFEGVQKCCLDETLFEVMERIVRAEVHRLVVVDDEDKVIGIISLSDLLMYLVLRPTGTCEGANLRKHCSSIEENEDCTTSKETETIRESSETRVE